MDTDRIHRTTSHDGTTIAGAVHGEGPPLVLVHGSLEDGDFMWKELLPFLDGFTCYLMSTRSRGRSDEHPDLSPQRLVEDVTAFADSIGEPVGLFGESAGGMLALGAAARARAVSAVAAYEPVVLEAMGEEDAAGLEESLTAVGEIAAAGRLAEAAKMFADPLLNDEERAALSGADYFEQTGRYVPLLLREIELAQNAAEGPTHPSVLAQIEAPVLAMNGERSALHAWFSRGVRHVTDHAPHARARQIPGAGHWGPVLSPEPIARELVSFFEAELGRRV